MSRRPMIIPAVVAIALALALSQSAAAFQDPASAAIQAPPSETTVAPLEVTAQRLIPEVGEGAPLYSSEELARLETAAAKEAGDLGNKARTCLDDTKRGYLTILSQYNRERTNLLHRAQDATKAAEAVRTAFGQDNATRDEWVAAELARQAAVNAYVKQPPANAGDLGPLAARSNGAARNLAMDKDIGPMMHDIEEQLRVYFENKKGDVAPPREFADLRLEEVKASSGTDDKGAFLVVRGVVRNTRARSIAMPPLAFSLVDRFGGVIDKVVTDPENGGRIGIGQTKPFAFVFRPEPAFAASVRVTFNTWIAFSEYRKSIPDCSGIPPPPPTPAD